MDTKLLCIFVILAVVPSALSHFHFAHARHPKLLRVSKSITPGVENPRVFSYSRRHLPTEKSNPPTYNPVIVQPQFGRCNKGSPSYWGPSKEHHHHGHHHLRHYQFGVLLFHFLSHHFQTGYSNTKIIEMIKALGTEDSTEVLIQFVTTMTSSKAARALNYFGVKEDKVKELLSQLKSGNEAEVKKATETVQNFLNSVDFDHLNYFDWYYIRYLASLYYVHLKKEQAKDVVRTDPMEKLIVGLTVLASVEDRHNIRGIDFRPLVKILEEKGEAGREEVAKEISDWIDTADIRTLQSVGFIYSTSTQNVEVSTTSSTSSTTTTTTTTTTLEPVTTTTTTTTPAPETTTTTTTTPAPETTTTTTTTPAPETTTTTTTTLEPETTTTTTTTPVTTTAKAPPTFLP